MLFQGFENRFYNSTLFQYHVGILTFKLSNFHVKLLIAVNLFRKLHSYGMK